MLTRRCKGKNYAPLICGSLRSLYHKLAPLRFSPERGVSTSGIELLFNEGFSSFCR